MLKVDTVTIVVYGILSPRGGMLKDYSVTIMVCGMLVYVMLFVVCLMIILLLLWFVVC